MSNIITDEQIETAFQNTNFGSCKPKTVIADTIIKCATGYRSGHTAESICKELGLIQKSKWSLSVKGQLLLYEIIASLKAENEALKKRIEEKDEWIRSHI